MAVPDVRGFFDEATYAVSYVVADPVSGYAAIIDSVLDFDIASGRTGTQSADALIEHITANKLKVDWILDTHVHADHLSAAAYLQERVGGRTAIGEHVGKVQETFKSIFNMKDLATDGRQFNHLFADGETFSVGELQGRVMYTPGHTPACISYVIGDAAFVGDTLFMPDYGTARTDFPGGSAAILYESIQAMFALPDATRLYMCHDYKAPGRDRFAWQTTVREQREKNVHINERVSRDEFVRMRTERDSQLDMPKLILPSVQVNVRAGLLPDPEDNDVRYLKIPLNAI